ncbi:unnamed protein product [Amoebophrya sp. A120]|nr:unnamed protein product [Amoebophrya sp. A120]|eukprot:GSA120T00010022001.1
MAESSCTSSSDNYNVGTGTGAAVVDSIRSTTTQDLGLRDVDVERQDIMQLQTTSGDSRREEVEESCRSASSSTGAPPSAISKMSTTTTTKQTLLTPPAIATSTPQNIKQGLDLLWTTNLPDGVLVEIFEFLDPLSSLYFLQANCTSSTGGFGSFLSPERGREQEGLQDVPGGGTPNGNKLLPNFGINFVTTNNISSLQRCLSNGDVVNLSVAPTAADLVQLVHQHGQRTAVQTAAENLQTGFFGASASSLEDNAKSTASTVSTSAAVTTTNSISTTCSGASGSSSSMSSFHLHLCSTMSPMSAKSPISSVMELSPELEPASASATTPSAIKQASTTSSTSGTTTMKATITLPLSHFETGIVPVPAKLPLLKSLHISEISLLDENQDLDELQWLIEENSYLTEIKIGGQLEFLRAVNSSDCSSSEKKDETAPAAAVKNCSPASAAASKVEQNNNSTTTTTTTQSLLMERLAKLRTWFERNFERSIELKKEEIKAQAAFSALSRTVSREITGDHPVVQAGNNKNSPSDHDSLSPVDDDHALDQHNFYNGQMTSTTGAAHLSRSKNPSSHFSSLADLHTSAAAYASTATGEENNSLHLNNTASERYFDTSASSDEEVVTTQCIFVMNTREDGEDEELLWEDSADMVVEDKSKSSLLSFENKKNVDQVICVEDVDNLSTTSAAFHKLTRSIPTMNTATASSSLSGSKLNYLVKRTLEKASSGTGSKESLGSDGPSNNYCNSGSYSAFAFSPFARGSNEQSTLNQTKSTMAPHSYGDLLQQQHSPLKSATSGNSLLKHVPSYQDVKKKLKQRLGGAVLSEPKNMEVEGQQESINQFPGEIQIDEETLLKTTSRYSDKYEKQNISSSSRNTNPPATLNYDVTVPACLLQSLGVNNNCQKLQQLTLFQIKPESLLGVTRIFLPELLKLSIQFMLEYRPNNKPYIWNYSNLFETPKIQDLQLENVSARQVFHLNLENNQIRGDLISDFPRVTGIAQLLERLDLEGNLEKFRVFKTKRMCLLPEEAADVLRLLAGRGRGENVGSVLTPRDLVFDSTDSDSELQPAVEEPGVCFPQTISEEPRPQGTPLDNCPPPAAPPTTTLSDSDIEHKNKKPSKRPPDNSLELISFVCHPKINITSVQELIKIRIGLQLPAFGAHKNGITASKQWPKNWPSLKTMYPRGKYQITGFNVFQTDFVFSEFEDVEDAAVEWRKLNKEEKQFFDDLSLRFRRKLLFDLS